MSGSVKDRMKKVKADSMGLQTKPSGFSSLELGLWAGVLLSAMLVVWSTHQSRELLAGLMNLQAQENELQVSHGQYLLQEGTLASPGRLEQVAKDRLQMRIPAASEIKVIRK